MLVEKAKQSLDRMGRAGQVVEEGRCVVVSWGWEYEQRKDVCVTQWLQVVNAQVAEPACFEPV